MRAIKPSTALFYWCLLTLLSACSKGASTSPEQQVKSVLELIELAAEDRSLSGIMEHVSDSYRDHDGNGKNEIQRYTQMQFIARQNINIFTVIRSLEINNGIAAVELSAAMAGRDVDLSEQANRLRADTIKFSLVLELEKERWGVTSMSWQQGW